MTRGARFTTNRGVIILVGAGVIGVALRILGLGWGLPAQLHPDEWVITTGALDLAQRNSFEPSLYFRPDHVEIQLSYIAYQLFSHLVLHTSVEAAYAASPGTFLLISRLITALFGIAMIVLAYFIGRRFNRSIAIIAVVLFSIFPPLVHHSHYATPDVPLAAALMVVILALMFYQERPGYASLLIASGATSVAIAIKYPGGIAAVMIAVVIIVAAVKDRAYLRIVTHGLTAIAAVLTFLFLISPVLFTNINAVLDSIRKESRTTHPGADGLGWSGNLIFYANQYLLAGGILLAAAFVVGVVAIVRLRILKALPVLLGAVFWLILSAFPLHWERWGVPMYATFLLLSSIGIYYSYRYLASNTSLSRWRKPVTIVVVAVVCSNLLTNSSDIVLRFLSTDTRVSSQTPLSERGIDTDNAIFEGYTPLMPGATKNIFSEFTTEAGRLVAVDKTRQFVVTSSCTHDRFFQEGKYTIERAFYAQLESQFELEFVVNPADDAAEPSWFEPLNIIKSGESILKLVKNSSTGCTIRVYRIAA